MRTVQSHISYEFVKSATFSSFNYILSIISLPDKPYNVHDLKLNSC